MVDLDVLLEKINSIQNCLKRVHDVVENDKSGLEDLNVQDIVVLNLQRAIQLTIDIAFHVVASEQLSLPQTLRDAFHILQENKVIDLSLSKKMEKMVGFRNIAVHDYQSVNIEILRKIVDKHLGEIEDFYTTILIRYRPGRPGSGLTS
ncbi:MAG: DUF86 domain-containing protein [Waddliaceae bacterium]